MAWNRKEEYVGSERRNHHVMERSAENSGLKFRVRTRSEEILAIGDLADGCS